MNTADHATIRAAAEAMIHHLDENWSHRDEVHVGVVAVIAEVSHRDEETGDERNSIVYWCSDHRHWVHAGLFREAVDVARMQMEPIEELDEDDD